MRNAQGVRKQGVLVCQNSLSEILGGALKIIRMNKGKGALADQFFGFIAEKAFDGAAAVFYLTMPICNNDDIGKVICNLPEVMRVLLQRFLRLPVPSGLLPGDIAVFFPAIIFVCISSPLHNV